MIDYKLKELNKGTTRALDLDTSPTSHNPSHSISPSPSLSPSPSPSFNNLK